MSRDEAAHLQQPVELIAYPNDWQARALVMHLREEGIAAEALGGMLAGFRAEAPALVRVLVKKRDEDRAKLVLQQLPASVAQIDWASVDVGQLPQAEASQQDSQAPVPQRPAWPRITLVLLMIAMVAFLAVWQAFRGLTAWLTQIWPVQSPPGV